MKGVDQTEAGMDSTRGQRVWNDGELVDEKLIKFLCVGDILCSNGLRDVSHTGWQVKY